MNKEHIINRFVSYVTIDTESDPNNPAFSKHRKTMGLSQILSKRTNRYWHE